MTTAAEIADYTSGILRSRADYLEHDTDPEERPPMTTEAALRVVYADDVPYLALSDVAAFLLDAAATLDGNDVTAPAALRSIAGGLANYERKPA